MFVQLKKDFLGKPPGGRLEVDDADGAAFIQQGIAEAIAPIVLSHLSLSRDFRRRSQVPVGPLDLKSARHAE